MCDVIKWKICSHWNFFSSNQLFSNLFSKAVAFTKFLPKNRERLRVNFCKYHTLMYKQKFRELHSEVWIDFTKNFEIAWVIFCSFPIYQELLNPLPFFKNHLDNFVSKKMLELDKFVRSFNLLQIVSHDLIACWHRVKTISKPMLADVDNWWAIFNRKRTKGAHIAR